MAIIRILLSPRRTPLKPEPGLYAMRFNCALFLLLCFIEVGADTLDPVWVIGAGDTGGVRPAVGDVEHSEFTGSHTHIDPSKMAREISSLGQVISRESGIQLRQAGGAGTYSSITVRAASSAQTDVYFDGVLLNNAGTGGVDLSQIELLNVDSVDIYRGATPIQLGFGNLGGAVNIRGPRSSGKTTQLLVGAGSFNARRLQLAHQHKGLVWDTSVALTRQESDNRFTFVNTNGTPLNTEDDQSQKLQNGQFDRNSLLFKFGRQQHDRIRIDGLLHLTERQQGVPHFRNLPETQATYDTDSIQFQLNQRVTAPESGLWNNLSGVYINRNSEYYDDALSQIGLGAQNTRSDTDVLGARSYWERIGTTGTLAVNSELRNESLDQQDLLGSRDFSATRTAFNGAFQYSLFKLNDTLVITPALRIRSLHDRYDGVLREGRDRRSNTALTAQIGTRLEHGDRWQWSANLGQHRREPLFRELFGDSGFFIGNESLEAEEGVNVDAGLHWRNDAAGTRRVSLTAFASFRDELIVTAYDARGVGRSENTGKARIAGLESSIDWALSHTLRTTVNLTLQSAENLSNNTAFTGKQLAGEAQVAAATSLEYRRNCWSGWLDADILSERFYDTANLLPADDQVIVNGGISYQRHRVKSTLHLRNLGDKNVQDFNGFPRPGRSIQLSLTYRFI